MKRNLNRHCKKRREGPVVVEESNTPRKKKTDPQSDIDILEEALFSADAKATNSEADIIPVHKRKRQVKAKLRLYGRWTKREHERLMEALDLYGNAWTLVERHIGTRTRDQIRSHVQKHFLNVRRSMMSEMARNGELHKKVFLITREYRNNTRAIMETYNKKKKSRPAPRRITKKPKPTPIKPVSAGTSPEPLLNPNEFLPPINPNLELMWKEARENEERTLGRVNKLEFCLDSLEDERIEIMSLEKENEDMRAHREAFNYREDDNGLILY
eukprot:TRINITY_DN8957_c0_g1_i2.p1 TRINITY_DN8957_c0_g1~~TRINITY_DN8957_c0_g1_i2.p1  ORF type:complete len:271 (+),score=52.64 TRINITY_DN8957_c0_g1_i2:46-858(+)